MRADDYRLTRLKALLPEIELSLLWLYYRRGYLTYAEYNRLFHAGSPSPLADRLWKLKGKT